MSVVRPCQQLNLGFTLLEIMVALAILALVISSVMSIFSSALTGISKSDLTSEGVLVARNVMESHLLLPELQEGDYSGEVGDLFRWHVDVVSRNVMTEESEPLGSDDTLPIDWLQDDSPLEIFELHVTVEWPDASYPGTVSLTTIQTRIVDTESEETRK